jgi:hypothetical protein
MADKASEREGFANHIAIGHAAKHGENIIVSYFPKTISKTDIDISCPSLA